MGCINRNKACSDHEVISLPSPKQEWDSFLNTICSLKFQFPRYVSKLEPAQEAYRERDVPKCVKKSFTTIVEIQKKGNGKENIY